ncbi:hypothetical protein WJX77_006747 [Trebouxia sp. C0004]
MQSQALQDEASWQSVTWPDGTSYEGLVKGEMCHVRGVSNFADGDRYEGEFLDNQKYGLGVYFWHDGTSYRGVWQQDKMHGCGIKLSCDDSGNSATQAGLFLDDDFAGASSVCDVPAAKQAAQQALWAANLACGLESQLKADKLDASQTRLHERSSRISHTDAFKQRHVSS